MSTVPIPQRPFSATVHVTVNGDAEVVWNSCTERVEIRLSGVVVALRDYNALDLAHCLEAEYHRAQGVTE